MKIDDSIIIKAEKRAEQERTSIAKLDTKIKSVLEDHKLPVPQSFLGLHNKADYFHIQFWFGKRPIIAKVAERHLKPKQKLPYLQVLAYRQFKVAKKVLSKKLVAKLNYDHDHYLAGGLKALQHDRRVSHDQFNELPEKYQLVCEGFPIGHQSLKEQARLIKEDEVDHPKMRAKTWWSPAEFHEALTHYPVKLVKQAIDASAKVDGLQEQQRAVKKILKGHWSFKNPNAPKPTDFSKIKVTPINGAEQQSLF